MCSTQHSLHRHGVPKRMLTAEQQLASLLTSDV